MQTGYEIKLPDRLRNMFARNKNQSNEIILNVKGLLHSVTHVETDDVGHDIFDRPMWPRDAYEAKQLSHAGSAIVGDIGIHTLEPVKSGSSVPYSGVRSRTPTVL